MAYVVVDVEVRIVDPDGVILEGNPLELLAVTRNEVQTRSDVLPDDFDVDAPSAVRRGPASKIWTPAACVNALGLSKMRKELSCAERRSYAYFSIDGSYGWVSGGFCLRRGFFFDRSRVGLRIGLPTRSESCTSTPAPRASAAKERSMASTKSRKSGSRS